MKVDQCQPHENFWTPHQSSQVVNRDKTKPWLARNQMLFEGTGFGFVWCLIGGNLQKTKSGSSEGNMISCSPRLSFDPFIGVGMTGQTFS